MSSTAAPVKAMPGYNWKHMPLASAVMYSVISIAITLITKAVLSSYCACAVRARARAARETPPARAAHTRAHTAPVRAASPAQPSPAP